MIDTDRPIVDDEQIRDLAAVRAERDVWRMIAKQAIHRLHEQHVELTRMRDQHYRLIAEYREYRAATICAPRAAA